MKVITRTKMAIAALVMVVASLFSVGATVSPASAADTGFLLRTFAGGGAGGANCQAYIRRFDTPFGYAVAQIHGWNNCVIAAGTPVNVTLNWAGGAQNWNNPAGHYNASAQTWDFVAFSQGASQSAQIQIGGTAYSI
jgi:hypothetical protein